MAVLNDDSDHSGIAAYPNPAGSFVNVETGHGSGTLSIRNMLGAEVYTAVVNGFATHIDVSAFEKGIYIITFETESGSVQYRFIKL